MGRYSGPKARVNRRVGALIYENAGAARAFDRSNQPPGMHVRARRPSNFGAALMEKQKIKFYYGLGERQLRRIFEKASHMKGNTGEQLLVLCERRLDNIVRRAGFTKTRPQARQGVVHGHFQVNGVTVTRPSYILRAGDVVTVRPRKSLLALYRLMAEESSGENLGWLGFDKETLRATMQGMPGREDISLPVDANTVVEFLSR